MKLRTRTVEIAGITSTRRDLDDAGRTEPDRTRDGFLRGVHDLNVDRDPLYTNGFRHLLRDSGVKPLLLPARSPKLERGCRAVRWVRQVRVLGATRAPRRGTSPGGRRRIRPSLS